MYRLWQGNKLIFNGATRDEVVAWLDDSNSDLSGLKLFKYNTFHLYWEEARITGFLLRGIR